MKTKKCMNERHEMLGTRSLLLTSVQVDTPSEYEVIKQDVAVREWNKTIQFSIRGETETDTFPRFFDTETFQNTSRDRVVTVTSRSTLHPYHQP